MTDKDTELILTMSYWEQFNWEKELARVYPHDHPKRLKAHQNTNAALSLINKNKDNDIQKESL